MAILPPGHLDEDELRANMFGRPPSAIPAPITPGPAMMPGPVRVRRPPPPPKPIDPEVAAYVQRMSDPKAAPDPNLKDPKFDWAAAAKDAPTEDSDGELSDGQTVAMFVDALASGMSQRRTGRGFDPSFWTGLKDREIAKHERARELAKEEEQEQLEDPMSPQSKAAQSSWTPYLEAAGWTKEEIGKLSASQLKQFDPSNVVAMRQKLKAEEAARAQELQDQLAKEGRANAEWREREKIEQENREKLKRMSRAGSGYGAGGGGTATLDSAQRSLDKLFEGKVPPEIQARFDVIKGMPPKNRAAALNSLFGDIQDQKVSTEKRTAQQERELAKQVAAQRERYGKARQSSNLPTAQANYNNVLRALSKLGLASIDDNPDKDIPGYGAGGWMPTWMLDRPGTDLRTAMQELLDTKLRMATGAAAPEGEQKTFREILGSTKLSTDADLLAALRQVRNVLNEQETHWRNTFPQGAAAYHERAAALSGENQPDAGTTLSTGAPLLFGTAPGSEQSAGQGRREVNRVTRGGKTYVGYSDGTVEVL